MTAAVMTTSRAEQIDLSATPFYHVMSRCVRQNFLCGFDVLTQKDYSHRKTWILDRIKFLANFFAIKICAYAIMNNHFHLVLMVDITLAESMSDDDVIRCWSALFPNNANKEKHRADKIQQWRLRLSSISWFMQCLNQHIAAKANKEDHKKGRFWDGRYKSQALLDEGALLTAMAYVDLNPIRAGISSLPEDSDFTSLKERIRFVYKQRLPRMKLQNENNINRLPQPKYLVPFASLSKDSDKCIPFSLSDYLELVDSTGRLLRLDKKAGTIPPKIKPILARLSISKDNWLDTVQSVTKKFATAVGCENSLRAFGKKYKRGLTGIIFAREAYTV